MPSVTTPDGAGTRKFFISYTASDAAWAEWISWQVERERGWRAVVQAWDFVPGTNFLTLMDEAIETADAIVPVVSDSYSSSAFGRAEWQAFFRRDPAGRERLVIPVRVSDVAVEGLLGPIVHIDLVGLSEGAARTSLISGLRGARGKPTIGPDFPAAEESTQAPPYPVATPEGLGLDLDTVEDAIRRLRSEGVFRRIADWVLTDQLNSGGWGTSQAAVMRYVSGEELPAHDRREGGIISTYVALRALRAWLPDFDTFASHESVSRARSYFLERQAPTGGFGRKVRSRSGVEVHASVRHTAFSILALLEIDGPMEVAEKGLAYLAAQMSPKWWEADAAPALALVSTLALESRLRELAVEELRDASEDWMRSFDRERVGRQLVDLAQTSPNPPSWPPYGAHPRMVTDTALTVIDMLPRTLQQRVRLSVQRALLDLAAQQRADGGLPYDPGSDVSDFGMSAFLLAALVRWIPVGTEIAPSQGRQLEGILSRLTDFLVSNLERDEAWRLTYCDTVANVLLLSHAGAD